MSVKQIVVHVDARKALATRLNYVVGLANRFGAGVEGVFARTPPALPAALDGVVTPQLMEAQREATERNETEAKAVFDEAVAGVTGETSWRALDGYAANVLAGRAKTADLVVVGQTDPEDADAATDYDLPAEIVMGSGRPVLVVPYVGSYEPEIRHALVAWNGTKEAARSLSDAMPLLETAAKVSLLVINPGDLRGPTLASAADAAAMLARHGVSAEVHDSVIHDISAGEFLLSRASDLGADLLVMGAYGRPRLRELILGGATHDILRHMTLPVFMSH